MDLLTVIMIGIAALSIGIVSFLHRGRVRTRSILFILLGLAAGVTLYHLVGALRDWRTALLAVLSIFLLLVFLYLLLVLSERRKERSAVGEDKDGESVIATASRVPVSLSDWEAAALSGVSSKDKQIRHIRGRETDAKAPAAGPPARSAEEEILPSAEDAIISFFKESVKLPPSAIRTAPERSAREQDAPPPRHSVGKAGTQSDKQKGDGAFEPLPLHSVKVTAAMTAADAPAQSEKKISVRRVAAASPAGERREEQAVPLSALPFSAPVSALDGPPPQSSEDAEGRPGEAGSPDAADNKLESKTSDINTITDPAPASLAEETDARSSEEERPEAAEEAETAGPLPGEAEAPGSSPEEDEPPAPQADKAQAPEAAEDPEAPVPCPEAEEGPETPVSPEEEPPIPQAAEEAGKAEEAPDSPHKRFAEGVAKLNQLVAAKEYRAAQALVFELINTGYELEASEKQQLLFTMKLLKEKETRTDESTRARTYK